MHCGWDQAVRAFLKNALWKNCRPRREVGSGRQGSKDRHFSKKAEDNMKEEEYEAVGEV